MNKDKQFNWKICGQEKIINFLQAAILNNQVAHAYLLVGPSGLGKYTLAKEFAASLLCQGQETVPCGTCFHCQQLKSGLHPDVYTVERMIDEKTEKLKKDIIIDQIRDLKSRLQQGTFLNSYKIAIIPQAQFINVNAANGLLKILEEPTEKTVIILIANDAKKLPATIVSRCQVLKFLPVATKKIEQCIKNKNETINDGEIRLLARLAHGRPGIAIAFAGQKELWENYSDDISNFFQSASADLSRRFKLAGEIIDWDKDEVSNAKKINSLLNNWQSILRDLLLMKSDNEPLVANLNFLDALKKQQNYFTFKKIKNIFENINQARIYLKQNISSKLILENLIINL